MPTNDDMVDALRRWGAIRSKKVEGAFRKVDRALFVEQKEYAYEDMALPTRSGQTISAPGVVAAMLEWLNVNEGMNILDVGSGSGYNAALLAELTGKSGRVITIEKYSELSELAKKNISKLGTRNSKFETGGRKPDRELPQKFARQRSERRTLETGNNIIYEVGDGSEGCEKYAPYDRIIVTAAMPWFDGTHPLAKQLKEDGKLVAPVGERYFQNLIVYDKKTNSAMKVLDVIFVPLVGKYGFRE